jgi:hypothetical protein
VYRQHNSIVVLKPKTVSRRDAKIAKKELKSIWHAVGYACDAVFDECDVEVDKQAQALVRQAQVGQ